MHRSGLLLFCALLVASAAACGGEDGGNAGGNEQTADTVNVTMRQRMLFMPRAVRAGPVVFQIRNAGSAPHGLHVRGDRLADSLASPLAPGATQTLALDLAPGTYEVTVPGDTAMDEQLTAGEGWDAGTLPSGSDLRGSLLQRR